MSLSNARRRKAQKASALAALRTGRVTASETLRRRPRPLRTASLWQVLLACPGVGAMRARRICEDAGVWPLLKLQELSPRQVEEIVLRLPPSQK